MTKKSRDCSDRRSWNQTMFYIFAWKMTETIMINFLQLISAALLYSFIDIALFGDKTVGNWFSSNRLINRLIIATLPKTGGGEFFCHLHLFLLNSLTGNKSIGSHRSEQNATFSGCSFSNVSICIFHLDQKKRRILKMPDRVWHFWLSSFHYLIFYKLND